MTRTTKQKCSQYKRLQHADHREPGILHLVTFCFKMIRQDAAEMENLYLSDRDIARHGSCLIRYDAEKNPSKIPKCKQYM